MLIRRVNIGGGGGGRSVLNHRGGNDHYGCYMSLPSCAGDTKVHKICWYFFTVPGPSPFVFRVKQTFLSGVFGGGVKGLSAFTGCAGVTVIKTKSPEINSNVTKSQGRAVIGMQKVELSKLLHQKLNFQLYFHLSNLRKITYFNYFRGKLNLKVIWWDVFN